MRLPALLFTGALGLALGHGAAATPMIGTIAFTAGTDTGSLSFSFDSTTAPVAAPCGAACALIDFAFRGLDESAITGFDLVFDPATVVKSWSATAFIDHTVPNPNGGIDGDTGNFTYTGNADHSFSTTVIPTVFFVSQCGSGVPGCFTQNRIPIPPQTDRGTWSASVADAPAQVPEPGSAALALLGLGTLFRHRPRRA